MSPTSREVDLYGRSTHYITTLPQEHLLYPRYRGAVSGLRPESEAVASRIVGGAPMGGASPAANAEYLAHSPVIVNAINEAIRESSHDSEPLIEGAREHAENHAQLLDEVQEIIQQRTDLRHQVRSLDSKELKVEDIYGTHEQVLAAAARAESSGDLRHRENDRPGAAPTILGLLLSGFEIFGLWVLVFNPSSVPALLVFIVGAGLLVGINHFGLAAVGHSLRTYLRLREARHSLHNRAHAHLTTTDVDLIGAAS